VGLVLEAERLTCEKGYLDAGSLGVWKYLVESLDLRCSSLFFVYFAGEAELNTTTTGRVKI